MTATDYDLLLVVVLLVISRLHTYLVKDNKPTIPAVGVPPGPLGSWKAGLRFFRDTSAIIQDGYEKYAPDGKSFRISTLPRWVVMVTDDAVLKELQNADERIISMQAAADERNSISYILGKCIHEKPYHVAIILKNLT
ncbi:uncharacterized protein ASPGLDRAFT_22188 [Aspergillus glaucus CBS 516.65]|uniref:Cytochrome P450 n=1 Tax=Aspergillus glaucus CBS 516.65 TaxID=1160497 RepID=A0A1L9VXS8_ASPGL|nr:hypothetical protein ASPGLDRAFT_22188 [Aspergillus glaucus CBS 516.65]OJJ88706.1 hypothetical protein ASPGLDRAFT_22188 [Aspergillus glaucus CBS 516.65]